MPFSECAVVCGRRAGKSHILSVVATYLAMFVDWAPYLAAGEYATIAIVCADRAQARTVIRYVKGLIDSVPAMASMLEGPEHSQRITLSSRRVVIEISTAGHGVRGYSYAAIICDEIAFWSTAEDAAVSDTEILRALRPGLLTLRPAGSMLIMASSPYARRGALWESYRRHYSEDGSPVLVWKAASRTMNSTLDEAEIQRAMIEDPEGSASEYLAEFRSDISALLTRETVERCVVPGRGELPRSGRFVYAAFCDPSGGSSDSMTLCIGHGEDRNGARVAVVDALREIRAPFDPSAAVLEFSGLLRDYGLGTVTGDRYAGEWPPTLFSQHGVTYTPSETNKSELYLSLLPLINGQRIELPDDQRLIAQLCSLERRTTRGSGRDIVDHPPRQHDDSANVVAGMAQLVAGKPDQMMIWLMLGGMSQEQARQHMQGRHTP